MAYIDLYGAEVVELDSNLAKGSLASVRAKFSKANQKGLIEQLVKELEDGSLYLGDWRKGEIEIVGIKRVISNRFWTEVEYDVLNKSKEDPNKSSPGTYRDIIWNSGLDAGAGALLITKNKEIVVNRSFRHAARRWCLELPRGIRKPGESMIDCAKREAREECGATPTATSQLVDFGVHDPDTGALRQEAHIICITDVEVDENKVDRDVSESVMGPVVVSLNQFMAMVAANEIRDGWIKSAVLTAVSKRLVKL